MSLVQHVSAQEGVDREPDEDLDVSMIGYTRILAHRISYDVFPPLITSPTIEEKVEHLPAYEVSTARRLAQVAVGVVTCVTATGVMFGFAALKTVLVNEGVYHNLCTADEQDKGIMLCYLQDQKLNLIFIIASVTANMGALVVGAVLDRYGPKVCGYISAVLLVPGALCMAFNDRLPLDMLLPGSFLLSMGGTFSFVPSFHLSNTFPRFQGLILALITGAFDASAAMFLLFRLLHEASGGSFGMRSFFLLYLAVPVFIAITQLLIMPSMIYDTRSELEIKLEMAEDPATDLHDSDDDIANESTVWKRRNDRSAQRRASIAEIRSILGTEEQQQEFEVKEDVKKIVSGVWGALHGMSAWKQIQTPWFILITLLTVLQMMRFNFFISTIWSQYRYLLDSKALATQVNEFFDLALPLGGVLTVPFIGLLLDNTSTVVVLALIVLLSTVIGVLGAIPTLTAAYAKIGLFVIFRPLYYSAMSDYAAKVFGFTTFGTVYGTIICLSGLAIFSQSALQALVHTIFEEDPGPMNLWLAGIGLCIGLVLVMYVDMRGRVIMAEHAIADERRSIRSYVGRSGPGGSRRQSRGSVRELFESSGERSPLLIRKRQSLQALATVAESPELGSEESERERDERGA